VRLAALVVEAAQVVEGDGAEAEACVAMADQAARLRQDFRLALLAHPVRWIARAASKARAEGQCVYQQLEGDGGVPCL
jgi:ATP/maltotriose-dependent transcriptional regulator MalT